MSIKRRLMIIMMGISMTAVILTVTAITVYLIYDIRAAKQQDLAVTAVLTGDRNNAALQFRSKEHGQKNLEIFQHNPAIQLACIYDQTGDLFAGYENPKATTITHCPPATADVPVELPHMLTTLQPIGDDATAAGSVFIVSDTRELESYIHKILQISTTTALLVIPVILLLTYYLQRSISRPIRRLANTVQTITREGDYNLEAESNSYDETNTLARSFNAMLAEVRKRDRKLVRANETLEHKVIARTQELLEAMKRAEQANNAKTEFLRNISHEFRTPLHALISFSAYGINEAENGDTEQLKQYFTIMEKSSERLTRLVNEILDISSMEAGELKLTTEIADLREPVSRAVESILPLMQEKNIAFHWEKPAQPYMVPFHFDKMEQVVTNLLGNAIKFTPPGKNITLTMEIDEKTDRIVIAVRDEGIGIPEGEVESIFEFFQQSSRTNSGAGGTGLGLAICKGIVNAHGGKIWAQNNRKGEGACVTFTLPRRKQNQQQTKQADSEEGRYGHAA